MKTLHLAIITIASIASLVVLITFIIFKPVCVGGSGMCDNAYIQQNNNATGNTEKISDIVIPPSAEDPSSGKNYEPRYLVVALGVNNTVRWINESPSAAHTIVADNQDDQLFWNATRPGNGSSFLLPGKTFNFTFTKAGEFYYHTEPHPWMQGSVLVLSQSNQNAIQTVTLNSSSKIPDPCATFGIPCPNYPPNYNFTAQRFGPDIYIEKFTVNGVDNYAIIKPRGICYYPPTHSNSCTTPDDLAILRLVGVDTSIPQQFADITISGLQEQYAVGEPISFELKIHGYGYDACEIPYVSALGYNSAVWQSLKTPWISCIPGRGYHDTVIDMNTLGGPFSINQTGTYTVHVDYASNSTEAKFEIVPKTVVVSSNKENTVLQTGVLPSCVTNMKNQYAIAGAPGFPLCPASNFSALTHITGSTGFYGDYTYDRFPSMQEYVLEPGHSGIIMYSISTGTLHLQTYVPEYPNKVNIPNYVDFMHDAGMHNHPGVNVTANPLAQILGSNESESASFTFSATNSAPTGSYWVTLPPGICSGGQMLVLTIANCTGQ